MTEEGADEASIAAALTYLPSPQRNRRTVVRALTEEEAVAYEKAADALPPGPRALALLPLALGLRSDALGEREELLSLEWPTVQRAAGHGELFLIRKGDKEVRLALTPNQIPLFEALLTAPRARGRKRLGQVVEPLLPGRRWNRSSEILSPGKTITAYHLFNALVHRLGAVIGRPELRPHLLRHAFATRMARDGAPLPAIQFMLSHADAATTQRYVAGEQVGAEKWMR
jgi:integrase/recombinase XerD